MNENRGKSMRDISPKICKCLKEQIYIRNVIHQHLGYKFQSTKNNSRESIDACKTTLKESEASGRREASLVFLRRKKTFTGIKKSVEEMTGDCVRTDPTEVPTVMQAHEAWSNRHIMTPPFFPQGLRVNADADAYVETLRTIVKLP
ncbi:hypothetical protein ACTXT7_011644 [Hymenolepis weldensis]